MNSHQYPLSEKVMSNCVASFFRKLFWRRFVELRPVSLPETGLAIVRINLGGMSIFRRRDYVSQIRDSLKAAKEETNSTARIILMPVLSDNAVDIVTWTDEELARVGLARIVEAQP